MENDNVHYTFTSFKYIPTLLLPTPIIFHQQPLQWPLLFLSCPPHHSPLPLMLPNAFVALLKYRYDRFTPAFEWVPLAFRIKSKHPLTWLIRLFLFCAWPAPSSSAAAAPQHGPCASSVGNSFINTLLLH